MLDASAQNIRDQRQGPRYALQLPIEWANGVGTTRNISGNGVLFATDESFAVGAVLWFLLTMRHTQQADERIACQGKVVRVEQSSELNCVAVALEGVQFAV